MSTDFGKLDHSLENWEGDAADNFATNFYNPFEDTLRSQKQVLLALAGGIAAAKAIAEATQQSLMHVVHHTREALREQLELAAVTAEVERQATTRSYLILAGGGASIFSGLVTKGLMAMTPVLVSGAASVTLANAPGDAFTDFVLQGSTAADLLSKMSDAISKIDVNDSDQHHELMLEIEAALRRVETRRRVEALVDESVALLTLTG